MTISAFHKTPLKQMKYTWRL